MGLIGSVIEFLREQIEGEQVIGVKFDPGGEDTAIADHVAPAGIDAPPLQDDYVGVTQGAGTGRWVVLGYVDPKNEGIANPGEVRLYSRDSDGAVLVTLRMAADEEFVHIGQDVCEELIARADRVEAELEKLKTAHNDHKHAHDVCAGGTSAVGALAGTSDTPDKTYDPGAVGCDKVKGV